MLTVLLQSNELGSSPFKCTGAKTVPVVFAVPSHRNNALRDHFLHDIRLVRIMHPSDCAIIGETERFDHFGVKSGLSKKLYDLGQESSPISDLTRRWQFWFKPSPTPHALFRSASALAV